MELGPQAPGPKVASHVALGRLRPAWVEGLGQSSTSQHRQSPTWMLGSLSEVLRLIPWVGCQLLPGKVLVASHQPQAGGRALGVCRKDLASRSVFWGSKHRGTR